MNKVRQDENKCMIDIGGATGEFLYYIRSLQPDMQLRCIEYSKELVHASKSRLHEHNIFIDQGDANDMHTVGSETYDYVTTLGVTSIFDDFKPSFSEMIRVAKNGASCINSMLVNESPIDVIIKYINPSTGNLESGWNKFSLFSIEQFLKSHQHVGDYYFEKHVMPFDIEKREDVMRSWTKQNEAGERILWNGLGMEISIYHIVFTVVKEQ